MRNPPTDNADDLGATLAPGEPVRARRTRRVTLEQVAAVTGLGRTTVSDILNRNVGDRYSASTRKLVEQAVAELGYTPVRAAQQLARGRSGQVGLMLTRDFSNPFFARVADVVEREVRKLGFRLQMSVTDGEEGSEAERLSQLRCDAVEGLIVGPVYENLDLKLHRGLLQGQLPTVVFGGAIGSEFDEIALDHVAGWRLAVQHLLDRGHRKIGFMAPPSSRTAPGAPNEAYSGVQAFREAGIYRSDWFHWEPDTGQFTDMLSAAQRWAARWLTLPAGDRPTAVICHNDQVALTTLAAFTEAGINVPGDVSVIGCDNLPESGYLTPALTTIDNHVDEQMRRAVARLNERIAMPHLEPVSITIQPTLVVRKSVKSLEQ